MNCCSITSCQWLAAHLPAVQLQRRGSGADRRRRSRGRDGITRVPIAAVAQDGRAQLVRAVQPQLVLAPCSQARRNFLHVEDTTSLAPALLSTQRTAAQPCYADVRRRCI